MWPPSLGDDAIPQLVTSIDALPESVRDDALAALRERRRSLEAQAETGSAWQAWNLSRERAREALRSIPER